MSVTTPAITIAGDQLRVLFDRFDPAGYQVFLKCKRLPEYRLSVADPDALTYEVTAPARFASMLGVQAPGFDAGDLPLATHLFDDQLAIVRMALEAKRFAVWADCGLGKTPIALEWARQVCHKTGGRVLIFTLNEIVPQWIEEAQKFYGNTLPIIRIESREHMKQWCSASVPSCLLRDSVPLIAVVNYEKLNHKSDADQVVNELRHLAGIVADESSRLKTGGGKQKWALIKSSKGVEYKLSCTATPAPNEVMEFASQASFLEKLRDGGQNEILWTYFQRDQKTHRWTVRRHARAAFFEFMSAWSIYVRDPRKYGWRTGMVEVPAPEIIIHKIAATPAQRDFLRGFHTDDQGNAQLFGTQLTNTIQRNKLSQVARGFRYRKGEAGAFDRIESDKPDAVARLIKAELRRGLQVLVWTVFDAETQIINEALERLDIAGVAQTLTGKTPKGQRGDVLENFRHGKTQVLISRPVMLGYGMNLQHCGSMIFSGFNDSYEQFYQALRRAYRYGQTRSLRVHIPYIPELEGEVWDNITRKQAAHEAAIAEMETNYIRARGEIGPRGRKRGAA